MSKLIKEKSIKKLFGLIAIIGIVSTIPTPPIGHSAYADVSKTTKITKPAVKVETTHVEAVQAAPAPEPVADTTPAPTPVVDTSTQPTEQVTGDKASWMVAAGISQEDYIAVDYIISHESGWNPYATNASSGAHGLPQALPYSKTGCGWDDAICQLQWASSYASSRYGGWQGAYNFWINNNYW